MISDGRRTQEYSNLFKNSPASDASELRNIASIAVAGIGSNIIYFESRANVQ